MSDPIALSPVGPPFGDLRVVQEAFLRGLAHAADGLAALVGRGVRVVDPDVSVVPLAEVARLVGVPDRSMVGIYLAVTGPIAVHVVLLMEPPNALSLVDLLMGQESGTAREVDEMSESALGEVGNIMGSFFATVVGDLTRFTLWSTTPVVRAARAGALVDGLVARASDATSRILVISTRFEQQTAGAPGEVSGIFVVLPEADALEALVKALNREAD